MNTFYIRLLSVGYLLLATLLFLSNWFYLKYALIFVIGHLLFFAFYSTRSQKKLESVVDLKSLLSIGALALIWTFLMGVGGVFHQTTDFLAHNSKFYEIYNNEWPILYKEKNSFSCYYYGYYLVSGLLSKLTGSFSVSIIVVYTWFGIWLGLTWLYLLLSRNLILVAILIMSGGIIYSMEIVSLSIFNKSFSYNPLLSLFIQSLFVPNQIISVLITTGIFLYYIKDFRISFYPITLSFYWGVFPAFLLMLLFGVTFLIGYFQKSHTLSIKSFSISYLFPAFLFLPTFVFLTSSNQMPVHGFYDYQLLSTWIPLADMIFLGIVIVWLANLKKITEENLIPLYVAFPALILLTILQTYKLGIFNDLFLRGSIPLYLIVLTFIFQRLYFLIKSEIQTTSFTGNFVQLPAFLKKYAIILSFLGIGFIASFYQLSQSLRYNVLIDTYKPLPYSGFTNSYQAMLKYYGEEGANQYLGNSHSFYYQYLAPVKAKKPNESTIVLNKKSLSGNPDRL